MIYKHIHIGNFIKMRMQECNIDMNRACNFFKCHEDDIVRQFNSEDLRCNDLLKWSKLLEYDFFRIYTQHLILYSPPRSINNLAFVQNDLSQMPAFRKSIYTKEIIEFILEKLKKGDMSKQEIMDKYNIPKTTLYKWISKYDKND